MSELSSRDRALVGLGAALGSNCIPCVEHHVALARDAGVTDDELRHAISVADTIRQVPAKRALASAHQVLATPASGQPPAKCEQLERKPVDQTLDAIAATVGKAMSSCKPEAAATKAPGGCC